MPQQAQGTYASSHKPCHGTVSCGTHIQYRTQTQPQVVLLWVTTPVRQAARACMSDDQAHGQEPEPKPVLPAVNRQASASHTHTPAQAGANNTCMHARTQENRVRIQDKLRRSACLDLATAVQRAWPLEGAGSSLCMLQYLLPASCYAKVRFTRNWAVQRAAQTGASCGPPPGGSCAQGGRQGAQSACREANRRTQQTDRH